MWKSIKSECFAAIVIQQLKLIIWTCCSWGNIILNSIFKRVSKKVMQKIVCYMFLKTLVVNKVSKIIWYIALQIKKWTWLDEDIYIQWRSNSRTTISKVDMNNWKYVNVSSEKVFKLCEHHFISKAFYVLIFFPHFISSFPKHHHFLCDHHFISYTFPTIMTFLMMLPGYCYLCWWYYSLF